MPSYTPPALNQNPRDLIIEGCRIATEENGSFQLMVNGVPVRIKPDSDPSELYSRWMSDLGRAL